MADRAVGIPIVREGMPFVAGAAVLTGGAWLAGWTIPTCLFGTLTLFTAWFFRNPSRKVPAQAGIVVAPGDGKVIAVDREFEPRYIKDASIRVSIFLNVFDVHVNRIPCAGTVEDVVYQPGKFIAANKPEATIQNEQNALCLKTAEGAKVLCVQVAGLIARRIVCWLTAGARVKTGERYGLIRFGSRMDLYLPATSTIRVSVGNRVKGGETIVGELQ
ncbi:MAG TPA: phosphatidylserine decarboxylase family protein [Nitrospiraceae bacterium]|nr:phosphatidylserine decarboxylase family protein [Nitrospiraceae bacterium]